MLEAKRTLVKSAPELWAELSDPEALGRHLAAFGAVRVTGARPEARLEWEAERASGRIELAESGFGTRVVMTAEPATEASPEPEPQPRQGFWARLLRRREPPAPPPAPPAAAIADETALRVLSDALDALGRAHHRPFSRA